MFKKFLLTTLLLTNLCDVAAFAESQMETVSTDQDLVLTRNPRNNYKLSLNLSYFSFANSNRGMGEFMLEFADLYGFLYEKGEDLFGIESERQRFWYDLISAGFVGLYMGAQVSIPYHEFGHFSRVISLGAAAKFEGTYTDFFDYFISRFSRTFSGSSVHCMGYPGAYHVKMPPLQGSMQKWLDSEKKWRSEQSFLVSAAGINNESYLSELMSEKAYLQGIHPATLAMYLNMKLGGFFYATVSAEKDSDLFNIAERGHDIMEMVEEYRKLGKNIKTKDISTASLISFFASGGLYAQIFSFVQMCSQRNYMTRSFELFGVRLPETTAYFMPRGISYKVSSGYRYDENLVFPTSVEFIQNGDDNYEVTFGMYKVFPGWRDLNVRADMIISDQGEMGGKIYAEASILKYLYVGAGIENYNSKTLHGLRNIPHQEKGETRSTEFWLQVGLKY